MNSRTSHCRRAPTHGSHWVWSARAKWPPPALTDDVLTRYLTYFHGTGFLPSPQGVRAAR
nr:hypothetical protein [Streptomyces sp. SID7834]